MERWGLKPTPLLDQSVSQSVSLQTSRRSPPPLILRGEIVAQGGKRPFVSGGNRRGQRLGVPSSLGAPIPSGGPGWPALLPFSKPLTPRRLYQFMSHSVSQSVKVVWLESKFAKHTILNLILVCPSCCLFAPQCSGLACSVCFFGFVLYGHLLRCSG